MNRLTLKHTIPFFVLSLCVIYAIGDGIGLYKVQDSSPKQTTALLRLIYFEITSLVAYFLYFKIADISIKDFAEGLWSKRDKKSLIIHSLFIIGAIVMIAMQSSHYSSIAYSQALESLNETLNQYY